jgi:predicted acyl esterase
VTGIALERDVWTPMRDGVGTQADMSRPADPVLLQGAF